MHPVTSVIKTCFVFCGLTGSPTGVRLCRYDHQTQPFGDQSRFFLAFNFHLHTMAQLPLVI